MFAFNLCKLWMYTCCKSCNKDHPFKDVIVVFSFQLVSIDSVTKTTFFLCMLWRDIEHKRKRPWFLYFGLIGSELWKRVLWAFCTQNRVNDFVYILKLFVEISASVSWVIMTLINGILNRNYLNLIYPIIDGFTQLCSTITNIHRITHVLT